DRKEAQLVAQLDIVFARLTRNTQWIKSGAASEALNALRADRSSALGGPIVALSLFHAVSGDLQAAREMCERAVAIARVRQSGLLEAAVSAAFVRLLTGEFGTSLSLASEAFRMGDHPDVSQSAANQTRCMLIIAWSAWCLGRYEESHAAQEGILAASGEGRRPPIAAWIAPRLEWLRAT